MNTLTMKWVLNANPEHCVTSSYLFLAHMKSYLMYLLYVNDLLASIVIPL